MFNMVNRINLYFDYWYHKERFVSEQFHSYFTSTNSPQIDFHGCVFEYLHSSCCSCFIRLVTRFD